MQEERPVRGVVDRLSTKTGATDVPLRDLVQAFGEKSFVPALMVPALLVVSPLSGIPLFSTICGLIIAIISVQMLVARDHLWLPEFLMKRTVPGPRLAAAVKRMEKVADWIDNRTRKRLSLLVRMPGKIIPQALCVISGAAMPFLEIVPFSSSILGGAVLSFSVGFLSRDGVFMLGGVLLMGLAVFVPITVITTIQ